MTREQMDKHLREQRERIGITVHEGTGLIRPWWGTMTHGSGQMTGIWRAHTRKRLVAKMARYGARLAINRGADRVVVEVRDA